MLWEYIALSQPLQTIIEIMVKASDYLQVLYLKDIKSTYIKNIGVKVLSCQI